MPSLNWNILKKLLPIKLVKHFELAHCIHTPIAEVIHFLSCVASPIRLANMNNNISSTVSSMYIDAQINLRF